MLGIKQNKTNKTKMKGSVPAFLLLSSGFPCTELYEAGNTPAKEKIVWGKKYFNTLKSKIKKIPSKGK